MNSFSLRGRTAVLLCVLSAPGIGFAQAPDVAKFRSSIDKAAMRVSIKEPDESVKNFQGNLAGWLVSQTILSAKEETKRAKKEHKKLRKRFSMKPAQKSVAKLFEQLVHAMPLHQKPFRFRLFIVDGMKQPATVGGGYVYLPKQVNDAINDKATGRLAFHLAHQLGHNARGHARHAYQLEVIREGIDAGLIPLKMHWLEKAFGVTWVGAKRIIPFLYANQTEFRADLYAYHLCRNAGIPLESCIDALRETLLARYPDFTKQSAFSPDDDAGVLLLKRLKRLLMERDGMVNELQHFGLFLHDTKTGTQTRCASNSIKRDTKLLIFVHGTRGGEKTFGEFLGFVAKEKLDRDYAVLVFRFPNNGSLARSGLFLHKEIQRVVADPSKASFICHSAGGLVFRFYAEKKRGEFRHAFLLGTPHGGTNLTQLKVIVDTFEFFKAFELPITSTIRATLREGEGQIGLDQQPHSLFLTYLGRDPKLTNRYHCIYGRYVNRTLGLTIRSAFGLLKQGGLLAIEKHDSKWMRKSGAAVLNNLVLPDEILNGDLVVTTDSAQMDGATNIRFTKHHQSLKTDRQVFDRILEILKK